VRVLNLSRTAAPPVRSNMKDVCNKVRFILAHSLPVAKQKRKFADKLIDILFYFFMYKLKIYYSTCHKFFSMI
jgi:hypothetical protein